MEGEMHGAPRVDSFVADGHLAVPSQVLLSYDWEGWGCTWGCTPPFEAPDTMNDWLEQRRMLGSEPPPQNMLHAAFDGPRLVWSRRPHETASPPLGDALEEFLRLHRATADD